MVWSYWFYSDVPFGLSKLLTHFSTLWKLSKEAFLGEMIHIESDSQGGKSEGLDQWEWIYD